MCIRHMDNSLPGTPNPSPGWFLTISAITSLVPAALPLIHNNTDQQPFFRCNAATVSRRDLWFGLFCYCWTILALLIKQAPLTTRVGLILNRWACLQKSEKRVKPLILIWKNPIFKHYSNTSGNTRGFPEELITRDTGKQEGGRIEGVQLLWIDSFRAKQAGTARDGGQSDKHTNWEA